MGGVSDDAIRERAYQIWEREGRPHGRDFEHWVMAQVELATQGAGNGGARAIAPRVRAEPPKGKAVAPSKTPAASTRAGRGRKSG
jgi:Protein of unknown function (DUF2934)